MPLLMRVLEQIDTVTHKVIHRNSGRIRIDNESLVGESAKPSVRSPPRQLKRQPKGRIISDNQTEARA